MQILQLSGQNKRLKGLHLRRLLQWFSLEPKGSGEEDEFEYVATILQNCSQMEDAREIILEPSRGLLRILLKQLSQPSVIRRRGIAGTVRNCCFEIHKKEDPLLSPSLRLIETIVAPLAGPEPQDIDDAEKMPKEWLQLGSSKRHESDPETRKLLVEALVLIAGNRTGREIMRKLRVYKIIKCLHEWIEGINPEDKDESEAVSRKSARAMAEEAQKDAAESRKNEEFVSQDRAGDAHNREIEADERGENTEDGLSPDDEKTCYAINVLVNYLQRDESENEHNYSDVSTAIPRDGETEGSQFSASMSSLSLDNSGEPKNTQENFKSRKHLMGTRTFELLQEDEEESRNIAFLEQQRRTTEESSRPDPKKLVSAAGFDDMD